MFDAAEKIDLLRTELQGMPVFLAGSLVAAEAYDLPEAHSDADVFTSSEAALVASVQRLLGSGFALSDRHVRLWQRWMRHGMGGWHTNSIRLYAPDGWELNMIFKRIGRSPVDSLPRVLESFDFGLLASGYDMETNQYQDMRGFFFPGMDPEGPLPMLPNKRGDWERGFVSQYNGLRQSGRYAKYALYGYDMSLVKPTLVQGYLAAATYLLDRDKQDKQLLGEIYQLTALHIENDEVDKLAEAAKEILYLDSLDKVLEELE